MNVVSINCSGIMVIPAVPVVKLRLIFNTQLDTDNPGVTHHLDNGILTFRIQTKQCWLIIRYYSPDSDHTRIIL